MIEELIDKTFHIRDASHIAHWKTKSYSEHMALGDYYEDIIEKIDEINENINKMLDENPGSKVKEIKISYLDDDKKKIHFDINIEVNKG